MKTEELNKILELHKQWLKYDKNGECANLSGAYLRYAGLSGADLSYADLSYAYLRYAGLSGADLSYADLSYADLRDADLRGADLSYADLRGADLRGASTGEVKGYTVLAKQMNTTVKNRLTQYWVELDIVTCGCQQLSLADFEERVRNERTGEILEKYLKVIDWFKAEKAEYDAEKAD